MKKKEMTLFDKVEAAFYAIEPYQDRIQGEIEGLQKDSEQIRADMLKLLTERTEDELEALEADF